MPTGADNAAARITKRAVDAAHPASKDTYLWDDELSGFGLKITPAGRKVYLVQYRVGGRKGRTRRVTIGQHGELTPTAARFEAKRLLGEIALGRDPASDRDRAKADKSLTVVLDQFMIEHVKSKRKASTAREYERTASPTLCRALDVVQLAKSSGKRLPQLTTTSRANLIKPIARSPCSQNSSIGRRNTVCGPMASILAGTSRIPRKPS